MLIFEDIYGFNVVIIEEDTNVEGGAGGDGVAVRQTGTKGDGDNGVDRWVVREVLRAVVGGVPLSKPWKSGINFLKCIPQCTR